MVLSEKVSWMVASGASAEQVARTIRRHDRIQKFAKWFGIPLVTGALILGSVAVSKYVEHEKRKARRLAEIAAQAEPETKKDEYVEPIEIRSKDRLFRFILQEKAQEPVYASENGSYTSDIKRVRLRGTELEIAYDTTGSFKPHDTIDWGLGGVFLEWKGLHRHGVRLVGGIVLNKQTGERLSERTHLALEREDKSCIDMKPELNLKMPRRKTKSESDNQIKSDRVRSLILPDGSKIIIDAGIIRRVTPEKLIWNVDTGLGVNLRDSFLDVSNGSFDMNNVPQRVRSVTELNDGAFGKGYYKSFGEVYYLREAPFIIVRVWSALRTSEAKWKDEIQVYDNYSGKMLWEYGKDEWADFRDTVKGIEKANSTYRTVAPYFKDGILFMPVMECNDEHMYEKVLGIDTKTWREVLNFSPDVMMYLPDRHGKVIHIVGYDDGQTIYLGTQDEVAAFKIPEGSLKR